MNQILFFCTAILFSSAVIGTLVLVLSALIKPLRYWPLLWAVALLTIIASSVLATAFQFTPTINPASSLNLQAIHEPLGTGEIIQWSAAGGRERTDSASFSLINTLAVLYITGLMLFLIRLINGRRRAARIARNSQRSRSSDDTEFWITHKKVSPFVIRRMSRSNKFKIVLPQSLIDQLDDEEINHILKHEKAHIKRSDDEIGLLLRILVALTWFTPISHLLFTRWAQSIEMQCDQYAINGTPLEGRRSYVNTLMKTLQLATKHVRHYPVASFTKRHIRGEKMRIKTILQGHFSDYQSLVHRLLIVSAAVCLTLGSAVFLAANAGNGDCVNGQTKNWKINDFMVGGSISATYGLVNDPFKKGQKRNHKGIDIKAPKGTRIFAPADGIVLVATDLYQNKPKYGKVVVIKTGDNTQTLLAHLDSYEVEAGESVEVGALIATVGTTGATTGPHVHIETYVAGKRVDPATVWNIQN